MKIHFEKLYEVEIYNEYYTSKISEDFDIQPTRTCQQLLRNYGLLFRKTKKGFVVLNEAIQVMSSDGTVVKGKFKALKPIEEDIRFSFLLEQKNPFLLNFTNLLLTETREKIYYFHNMHKEGPTDSDGKKYLTKKSENIVTEDDRVVLKCNFIRARLTNGNSVFILKNELTQKKYPYKYIATNQDREITLDIRKHPAGVYSLYIKGKEEEKVYFYINNDINNKQLFGIIDVCLNEKVEDPYRFENTNELKYIKYTIKLKNRSTFWKYNIFMKNGKDSKPELSELNIVAQDSITFDCEPNQNNPNLMVCKSSKVIPLKQKPIKGIKLVKNSSDLIKNLPNASITSVVEDASKFYSEINVYINHKKEGR